MPTFALPLWEYTQLLQHGSSFSLLILAFCIIGRHMFYACFSHHLLFHVILDNKSYMSNHKTKQKISSTICLEKGNFLLNISIYDSILCQQEQYGRLESEKTRTETGRIKQISGYMNESSSQQMWQPRKAKVRKVIVKDHYTTTQCATKHGPVMH